MNRQRPAALSARHLLMELQEKTPGAMPVSFIEARGGDTQMCVKTVANASPLRSYHVT